MRVRIVGPGLAWDALLRSARHDIYHTAGYHAYSTDDTDVEAQMVVAQDGDRGLAWPYLVRSLGTQAGLEGASGADIGAVYGYPGPLAWGCTPGDPFLRHAWAAVLEQWRSLSAVSAYTSFHPLLGNADVVRGMVAQGPEDGSVALGPTVSIDCAASDETAMAEYARVLRQEIARSRRAGVTTSEDVDWAALDDFVRLHDMTLDRNGAVERYRVTREGVLSLRHHVAPHLHLLASRLDGEVIAAGLFTTFDGIVGAYLVGTSEAHRRLSPLKVLLDDARRWAHGRGHGVLHLGTGRGGQEDSLFAFKARFSSRRHAFHTGRWVLDAVAYAALTATRHDYLTRRAEQPDRDWFPTYRAPGQPRSSS